MNSVQFQKSAAPGYRKKRWGIAVTILLATAIFLIPPAKTAFALDPLSQAELETIDGRAGIVLATGMSFDVAKISFEKMYWADPDSHPEDNNYGILVVSAVGGNELITFGLQLDEGGKIMLDCATTGAATYTIDQVTIPANTTFFSMVADAPVVNNEGRGLRVFLQTENKMNLGIGNLSNYTTSPFSLGSISVSDFFFGAVSDPDEPANNNTKVMIWAD